jgi:hypothetical protein
MFNLSILTSDMWAVVFPVFFYYQQVIIKIQYIYIYIYIYISVSIIFSFNKFIDVVNYSVIHDELL